MLLEDVGCAIAGLPLWRQPEEAARLIIERVTTSRSAFTLPVSPGVPGTSAWQDESQGYVCLAETISQRARHEGAFPEGIVWQFAFCLISSLAALHERFYVQRRLVRLLHFRLCPQTVWYRGGLLYVGDLRNCYVAPLGERILLTPEAWSTPAAITHNLEWALDIWAVGRLLQYICTLDGLVRRENLPYTDQLWGFIDMLAAPEDTLRPHAFEALNMIEKMISPIPTSRGDSIVLQGQGRDGGFVIHSAPRPDFTPLHLAVIAADMEAVVANLRFLRERDFCGRTALMLAASRGLVEALPYLLEEQGCMCDEGHTAYYYALRGGQLIFADALYREEYRLERELTPRGSLTASRWLLAAIECNELATIHYVTMTECYAAENGPSPMHLALKLGYWQAVIILSRFEAGRYNEDGETCLQCAARQGCLREVTILAAAESNIKRRGDDLLAIDLAVRNGRKDCVDVLKYYERRERFADNGLLAVDTARTTLLIQSVRANLPELVHLWKDDAPYSYDVDGYTALMYAVIQDDPQLVLLLRENTRQLCRNSAYKGLSSLWIATLRQSLRIVRILAPLEHDLRDPTNQLPMDYALSNGLYSIAAELEMYCQRSPLPTQDLLDIRVLPLSICSNKDLGTHPAEELLFRLYWPSWPMGQKWWLKPQESLDTVGGEFHTNSISIERYEEEHRLQQPWFQHNSLLHNKGLGRNLWFTLDNPVVFQYVPERYSRVKIPTPRGQIEYWEAFRPRYLSFDGHRTWTHNTPVRRVTRLMCAVLSGSLSRVFRYRKEMGIQSPNGTTALMLAAAKNDLPMIRLLLPERGFRRDDKFCALDFAHSSEAKALLAGDTACGRYGNGWTQLMVAILTNKRIEPLGELADCISQEPFGPVTALFYAAMAGRKEQVTELLRIELASSSLPTIPLAPTHHTPLMAAAAFGHTSLISLLRPHFSGVRDEDGYTALHIAAWMGHDAIVQDLVEQEGHLVTENQETALMMAAQNGSSACARLLLSQVGMRDILGRTALEHALLHNNIGVAQVLCNTDEVNSLMSTGRTVLMQVCELGSMTLFKHVMEVTDQVGKALEDGTTALLIAARHGHIQLVTGLLPHEIDIRGPYGTTPLIQSIKSRSLACVKLFLDQANLLEDDGYGPLYYACANGYCEELVELLAPLDRKTSIDLCDAALASVPKRDASRLLACIQKHRRGT
ncbi:Kinase, NEK [Giardia muris]|uniref:Kinase, NEK n=1 Tax=Giardia muris TaxID=5742 RepID=A0A4Z1SM58_GIAMU|nr:Kinase, NEK [Giardia muris]|eukprot:TNJ26762.1 Kinase, NEK [Giardia muris]